MVIKVFIEDRESLGIWMVELGFWKMVEYGKETMDEWEFEICVFV